MTVTCPSRMMPQHEDRVIRSVTPNPGAYTVLPGGARMKLGVAIPVERDDLEPGQLDVTKKQVSVGCAGGRADSRAGRARR